ncbi:MAG: PAS domain-containing protein [Bacteroidales bacterium]|nr:PAS domain-containing protein [Bacteroidales bacterium]
MRKLLKNSISNNIRLILLVALVDLSLITIFAFSHIKNVFITSEYSRSLTEVETDVLLMHKSQQDFMLKYSEFPDFFKTSENIYIDNFYNHLDLAQDQIKILTSQKLTTDLELELNLNNLRENLYRYRNLFDELTLKIKQYGNGQFGITGKLNNTINKILNKNEDSQLNELLLLLKGRENIYLQNPSIGNYNTLISVYAQTNSLLEILPIGSTTKTSITSALADYKNQLNSLKLIKQEIGIDTEHGLLGEIDRHVERILPELSLIKTDVVSTKKSYYNNAIIILTIVLLLTVIIAYFAVNLFSKNLLRQIKTSNQWIKRLSKGEIPQAKEQSFNKDELGNINSNLNSLTSGLLAKTEFANQIGNKNYSSEFEPLSDKDTLGIALIDMRDNLSTAQIEEEKRNKEANQRKWTNEGLNKFSEILRNKQDNFENFNYEIISKLTRYVNGSQGTVFLFSEKDKKEERYLELLAAFAYDKRKYLNKKVLPGEGLVGTVALEGETIHLKELPADYVIIGSGLGEAEPNSLLLVPLKLNDDVFGVVEIATFTEFQDYEIDFIEKVGEIIASTLQSVKIAQRTQKLLEQSRRQADEMSAQEEEMRQNLEELQATQEERARREAEISGILEAIDTSVLMIEMNNNAIITEINEKYLKIFNADYADFKGVNYFSRIDTTKSESEIDKFWSVIRNGESLEENTEILYNDQTIWLNQTFTPIFDNSEQLYKVLVLAIDITVSQKQKEELLEQAEEMTAQEEEMLQNFEELHAAQDEMEVKQNALEESNQKLRGNESSLKNALEKAQEKEIQYFASRDNLEGKIVQLSKVQENLRMVEEESQAQLAAINKTSILLEMDSNGIIQFPNENFCQLLKYSQTDLIEKNHKIVIPKELSESDEYKNLWEDLKSGKIQDGECNLVAKDKSLIKIQGTYVPVQKHDGDINKIIFIGTKLTSGINESEIKAVEAKFKQSQEKNKLLEIHLKTSKMDFTKQVKALEAEIKKLKNK